VNVSTPDGINFRLEAVNSDDDNLIDQLDNARVAYVINTERTPVSSGGFANTAIHLVADLRSEPAQVAQSGREALSALGKLVSLGLREAANHGHVGVTPANPQSQEQLTTCLIQLQVVVEALSDVVSQQQLVIQEMQRAHGVAPVVENSIVGNATDRERFVLSALAAILLEVADQPDVKPHSSDSYLPEHLIADAIAALKPYGAP
jgi:hypothetical protein